MVARTSDLPDPVSSRRLLFGLLSAPLILLSVPPAGLWPLSLVALVPLLWAVRRAPPGRALALGWTVGFVVNLVGFHWLVGLGARFGGLSTPWGIAVVLATALYQGSIFGWWALASSFLARAGREAELVGIPLSFALLEAVVPMIFPWYLAITASRAWPLLQVAEIGGPPAVSALLVLINLVLSDLGEELGRRSISRATRVAGAVVVAIVLLGLARAGHVAVARSTSPELSVAVVQPNFGITSLETRKHEGERFIESLQRATAEAGQRGAELVVWPESSFPYLFDRALDREFGAGHPWELRKGYRGRLLFGSLTHAFGTSVTQNSAVLVSASGRIAGMYDKQQLLVFGEYVPLADRFPEWAKRTRARLPEWPDIAPGGAPSIIEDGGLRIAALICYEDLIPARVHEVARLRPNLLVTVANHAWFEGSSAARHAAALATMRSVETRRDLVRATNTGVSSIVDALGRVQVEGPLYATSPGPQASADILMGRVRLANTVALGPHLAPLFPVMCAVALAVVVLRGRRRRSAAS
ncbi:MAG: apolipoprotein N-acyltransferase [Deltaproteobacteria bacterium]|nr:apolipoprotein N-acyltransferase [Deltaproteobacteria bacterium]